MTSNTHPNASETNDTEMENKSEQALIDLSNSTLMMWFLKQIFEKDEAR